MSKISISPVKIILPLCLFFSFILFSAASPSKVKVLYNSLDSKSITEHFAFYQLYPETNEGRNALRDAWRLLSGNSQINLNEISSLPNFSNIINSIVALVNKQPTDQTIELKEAELNLLEKLAGFLPNRKLKGFYALTEEEVLQLPPHEIDLARALFLSEMGDVKNSLMSIKSYEAAIDLMALQILTKISLNASPEVKIRAINDFIFHEMGYRFPPHSLYAKDIDVYTFLPTVLDSRQGVCLGVSILYIALAQRLNLPLEMITPPGHIYIRYRDANKTINIETTARGIHLDSDEYLSIDVRSLEQRNIKEVVGLSHINQAAVYWKQENYDKTLSSYGKAQKYLPKDMQLKEFIAYNSILNGQETEGKNLLLDIVGLPPVYTLSKETLPEDFLEGRVGLEGIKAVFLQVDENRASIIKKRVALENALQIYPYFRAGIFSLATTWLQLHRTDEALKLLERYHALEPNDITCEYYLTVLYMERLDYNKAWEHLDNTELLLNQFKHNPKTFKELKKELKGLCPQ